MRDLLHTNRPEYRRVIGGQWREHEPGTPLGNFYLLACGECWLEAGDLVIFARGAAQWTGYVNQASGRRLQMQNHAIWWIVFKL